jgi:hypothetical protein
MSKQVPGGWTSGNGVASLGVPLGYTNTITLPVGGGILCIYFRLVIEHC